MAQGRNTAWRDGGPASAWHLVRQFAKDRLSSTALETAVCLPVFLLLLFFIFELAFDAFIQVTLETTVQNTARQIQVGNTTGATAANFIKNDVCVNDLGLLNCNSLYVRVETFSTGSCSDFYTATTGDPPVDGAGIGLADYQGATGTGSGDAIGPTACTTSTGAFCDALPSQQIILSAAYLAPSFLQGLIKGATAAYNGHSYHLAFDTIGFETENFSISTAEPVPCPAS